MQDKKPDDRVPYRFMPDSSTSMLLVDTRASQSLEPIHLPVKLRDRIERAQRRANAAKDGVSIFTTDSNNSTVSGPAVANRRSSTAPADDAAAMLGERPRASTASGNPGLNGTCYKMHLPDVVLSHKMRDFEARANTGGIATHLPAEPADRTLQKLPLEDRERVLVVMQNKIQRIASDVEQNFARITKALNANGIFDATANIQRAQTLCLVDLQRRCKLDRLRDEAMREVLQLPNLKKRPSLVMVGKPSRKLSQLLKPPTQALNEHTTAPGPKSNSAIRKKRKPVQARKLPSLQPSSRSPQKNSNMNQQPSASSGQQEADATATTRPSLSRMLSRRGGLTSSLNQLTTQESTMPVNVNANEGDMYTRHQHVAQILQLLATSDGSNSKVSSSSNSTMNTAEADMENTRMLDPADEWAQRSASYQAVGARAAETLRRGGERQRWDTLGHFGSDCGLSCISAALRQRLENQQVSWTRSEDTSRSDDGSDTNGARDVKRSTSQQQRDKEAYLELQTRIRERLRASEKRTRTAAAGVRVVGTLGRSRQPQAPQTAPSKMMASNSAVSLSTSVNSHSRGSQHQQLLQQSPNASTALGVSASEPTLIASTSMADPGSGFDSPFRRSLLGTRGRNSVLEQKVLADSSQSPSRRGRRKESLIGAPHAELDSSAIGRHSEARIAYRRDSAQTWAWHLPPSTDSGSPADAIPEEDEENDEDKDRFEEGNEQDDDGDSQGGDEGEEGTEYGDDDWESVDSGHTSTRSSISMASVKRRVSSGNKKHARKRPSAIQRRSSRGAGSSRSVYSANALSGNALTLHTRLEVIWRVLQFPFSHKLSMLERLSTLQDADTFLSALEHWERVTPLVAIRQRMKLALSNFAERGKLRVNEWLTPSEFALVSSLSKPPGTTTTDVTLESTHVKTSGHEVETMSTTAFIDWIRDHIDAVTLQTQKLAHELKVHTGEELQFQGHPYPRRV